nr:HalOD1 output domain-containing protein [Haloarchaeobius salinus]
MEGLQCSAWNGGRDELLGRITVITGLQTPVQLSWVGDSKEFYYEPAEGESLSTEVVTAVAKAHDEDVIEQEWLISKDINTDALDGLFQERNLNMTLQFEADGTTVTIIADRRGDPRIKIESHR